MMYFKKSVLTAIVLAIISSFTLINAQSIEELQKLIKNERYADAKTMASNWLKKKPKEAPVYYYLGTALLYEAAADSEVFQANVDSAKLVFQEGIKRDDDQGLNYVGMGKIALLNNDVTTAGKYFDDAYKKDEKDVAVLTELGKAYATNVPAFGAKGIEVLKAAEQILDKKKKKDEKIDVYIALGTIYRQQNQASDAVAYFQKALFINDKLQNAYIARAEIYEKVNKTEAENLYKKAIEVDPSNPAAYRQLANLYYDYKDYANCAEYWIKYIDHSGSTTYKQQRLASIYYRNKQYDKAISIVNEAIKNDPENTVSLRLLGNLYLEMGDSVNAVKSVSTFETYLAKSKKITSGDYQNYGGALLKAGRPMDAAANYIKAFDADTNKSDLLSDAADIYRANKKFKDVVKTLEYKRVKSASNFLAKDYINLGIAHYVDSTYAEGKVVLEKFTVAYPTLTDGWFWLARTCAALDPDQTQALAQPYYEKVVTMVLADSLNKANTVKNKKQLVEAYVYLGFAQLNKKNNDLAKGYFEKVLAIEPENQAAKDGLANLEPQKPGKKPVKKTK